MNKQIRWILVLMSACLLLLSGLQLYWNYQNYLVTVRNFKTDVNAALKIAAEKEKDARTNEIKIKVKHFLADTTQVIIGVSYKKNYDQSTFTIEDTKPSFDDRKPFEIGFRELQHKKLEKITPELKRYFINRYVEKTFGKAIRGGYFYYDTQRLGDSTDSFLLKNKFNLKRLEQFFKKELIAREINAVFKIHLNHKKTTALPFTTLKYNVALREPFEMVNATFPTPNTYFFTQMKWIILSSFLLIVITILCFGYTIRTLLNQHTLNQIKDDFITNMTHEIKTPLSSINITAEALQKFDNDEVKRKEYLNIISYQVGKLDELANRLLSSSNVIKENGTTFEILDFNELIIEAISNLNVQIEDIGATLKFRQTAQIKVMGNRFNLVHVLMNLLDNSIKYAVEKPLIEIDLKIDKDFAVVTISDNGIGIRKEYQQKIFDKFFRVPTGNIHNVKGTGLGLNFAKTIIKQHLGELILKKSSPAGSTFLIKIPCIS